MTHFSEIKLFDLPTSAGCLEMGTELLPGHFRKHGIVQTLNQVGLKVFDLGALSLPTEPRHNQPPIRNFPLSRDVWEKTESFLLPHFQSRDGKFLLGLGGDCSIVVGTASAAMRVFGGDVHLLYLDGDVDSIAPVADKCVGSAGMGLWFLTQDSEYWGGPKLSPSQITVLGNKLPPECDVGISYVDLSELRRSGITASVARVLASIPKNSKILVHLDVDLIAAAEMPAAYTPREDGLGFAEAELLLRAVMSDLRVCYLEVSEFMPAKDPGGDAANAMIGLLTKSLGR